MADPHTRLLEHLLSSHSLFGAFDANEDVFRVYQIWDPPPATDEALMPGPDYRPPWTTSS